MPYKWENFKIAGTIHDRRRKLSDKDLELIPALHRDGASIHSLSRSFGCSRRLIQFLIYPERKKKNLKDRADRGGSKIYYKKDNHTKTKREHRRYKKKLYNDLKGETNNET